MASSRQPITDPKQALQVARVIWGALVAGVLVYFGVTLVIVNGDAAGGVSDLPDAVTWLPWLLAVAAAVLGTFFRGQIFKSGWVDDVVRPHAYIAGNIVAWALCEGAAFASLTLCVVERRLGSHLGAAALALGLLLAMWPNGRAMWPLGSRQGGQLARE